MRKLTLFLFLAFVTLLSFKSLAQTYATLPFTDDFESGSLGASWSTTSSNAGQVLVTGNDSPNGNYHMTMDTDEDNEYSTNEAWLHVDLSGLTIVDLSFAWKEFGDEDNTTDGVYFSDDGGSNFTKVYSLTGGNNTYQTINLDVDDLASSNALSLNATFVIKFQQYDNWPIDDDGFAFDDVSVTTPVYATLPFTDDFESGSLGASWSTTSSNVGQVLITGNDSPNGSYHMTMDVSSNNNYSTNEAWLYLDLSGKTTVDLSFEWKNFGDEEHTEDGVFFSDDGGSSFTKVYSLVGGSTSYETIELDISALVTANDLSLSSTFVVKFQQYDNYGIASDGFAFDDISVTGTGSGSSSKTWYSYESGDFDNPYTWTLDPSGTTYDNGLEEYPSAGEEIVILNGFTVTANISGQNLSSTTIEAGGILDMATTTGQNLGVISGEGTLRVKGTALPSGTYTDFVSTLGGTIEYYDTTGDLPTDQTEYNNLKMTNSSGSTTFTLVSDLTVNGTFSISSTDDLGTTTWQINDNSGTQRTITLNGDLNVAASGRITVGAGNENSTSQHDLFMYGNITNEGVIKFYDPTDGELDENDYGDSYPIPDNQDDDLHRNELQGNAVKVTFSSNTDQTVTCNNTTDFYRFIVDKGTGQQAIVTVNSTDTDYFRLFGPSNIATVTGGGVSADEEVSANALSIVNGTLELTGSIDIPNLCLGLGTSDYFPIPTSGALWLNGDDVTIQLSDLNPAGTNRDCRILMSGLLRVTAGTLNGGFSKGLGSQGGGAYLQEGGTVTVWQFRPRALGGDIIFSFNMTGGTLNVGYNYALSGATIDQYTDAYHRFDMALASSTFQMSGGILNVAKPTNNNNSNGGLFQVTSSEGNYNVTGGTVNLYTGEQASGASYPGYINTTAPLYNLNIYEESSTTQNTQLQSNLVVLNNFTINTSNSPSFINNDYNVTVGGNFTINSGTTYTPGTGVTTLNGTGAQIWTHNGTITSLPSVVMNKVGGTLTLAGTQTFPNITTALTLTSGTLADGGKTLTVSGTGVLTNNATHSGTGLINYTSTAATINGSNGTFGNLTIATSATIATTGKQTISGNLRLTNTNTTLNIASNALVVNGGIYSDGTTGVGFGTNKRILTSGLHNAGGLTRQGAAGDLIFPVGTSAGYTPNTINATASVHGKITVRPVNSTHPIVTTSSQSVRYYWRVTSSGYTGITGVIHKSYNYGSATEDGATYRAARYDPATYAWGYANTTFTTGSAPPIPNFSTGTSWTGVTGDQLDGEYTAGNLAAFGTVTAYFSRQTGNWNVSSTWSTDKTLKHTGAVASSNPTSCSYCPVVIGDGASANHTVTAVANSTCGTLSISTGSTLDASTFTGHNFGTSIGGAVLGRGTLRIAAAVFPAGDFTNFLGENGGTVEWYGTSKTLPTAGPAPQSLPLTKYYNLILNPNSGQTIILPATDLTVYNNWTQQTGTGTVRNNGARTLAIGGNLTVSSGTFSLTNSGNTTITVEGNVSNSGTFSTTSGTHTLSVIGGFTNNGTVNFRNTGTVALTFTGSSNTSFTGAGTPTTTLSTLTINKGTSATPTLTFNVPGTVNTTAATGGWLTITNGTFNWATSNTTSLSSTSYTIQPTAKLTVSAGTVNTTSGDNDAYDLFLNGALEVSGTGILNIGNTSVNGNNVDLEYGSAGVPSIIVSTSQSMWVKGSIRRSSSTLTGALSYTQTGGTVTVGGISSSDVDNRGVFEVANNAGSNFTLTGSSTLNVQRQTGGTSYTDLYINPKTSNISTTSTITVGLGSAGTTQSNFRINVAPSIGNFSIQNGGGSNAQTVNMFSNGLIVGGTLTVPTPSVLNTNSLDVTISGDLVCTGTYTGGTNNTTFNGSGAQSATLSALTTFNDLTISKAEGSILTLDGTSPTLQNLYIYSGILDLDEPTQNLLVQKNITNNSSQTGTGTVLIESTNEISNTITSNSGFFTNLTLGGTATTKTVTVNGDMTIEGVLNFDHDNRYLFIKSNRLTFGESASITGADEDEFIKTNGVTSDLGITKNWATGLAKSFIYEIGTSTNYTPASYLFASVTASGSLTVVPVNSVHLTYNQSSNEKILNYNWIVSRDASLDFTLVGVHTYSYPSELIAYDDDPDTDIGVLAAGYLDPNSDPLGWETNGHGGIATSTNMIFTNLLASNLPPLGGTYDYSVGTSKNEVDAEADEETLPNPILPLYSRLSVSNVADTDIGGTWISASNWTFDSSGDPLGMSPSVLVPKGIPVVILDGTRINISDANTRGSKAYKSTIDGILNVGTVTGHNLGIISGTGTMRVLTNTFPAGNYTDFVASGGGTIEYAGTMTMNNRDTYNNLKIMEGSFATVTMTASDLTVNGKVTIPSGTTLQNRTNDADISVMGGWNNSGTYNAGDGTTTIKGLLDNAGIINADNGNIRVEGDWDNSGTFNADNSTVIFGGSNAQITTGALTFNNLTMDKSSNTYTPGNIITVNKALTMASGILTSNSFPASPARLQLTATATTSGGSSSSFVDGQIQKAMNSGTDFTYPTGNNSRYQPVILENTSATDTWTISYVGSDPTSGGYNKNAFDDEVFKKISQYEYWQVARAGSAAADMTLSYGSGSYASGVGVGALDKLSIVHWDGSEWVAASGEGTDQSGDEFSGSFTVYQQSAFSPQTFGSSDEESGLPVTWLSFSGKRESAGIGLLWQTATEINNDHFDVERSEDGVTFEVIGSKKGAGNTNLVQSYQFLDTEVSVFTQYYYRIKQVDYDGQFSYSSTIVVLPVTTSVRWGIYPNPAEQGVDLTLAELTSSVQRSEKIRMQVVTNDGRVILSASGALEELNEEMNKALNQSAEGMFFVQIVDGDYYQMFKVVRK
ncbi:hypothetical protein [Reichenbachiella sp. MALMAid0571]|uniref:beta strand repeat-containing protein n=1 Tax=Reichenbachiella sp. MALMAid0571 TaxID=3143939 RepID=UPI0032DF420B